MATIGSREVIDEIIAGDGFYPGDENIPEGPVVRIVEYTDPAQRQVWGIVYESEARRGRLLAYDHPDPPMRTNPHMIWSRPFGEDQG